MTQRFSSRKRARLALVVTGALAAACADAEELVSPRGQGGPPAINATAGTGGATTEGTPSAGTSGFGRGPVTQGTTGGDGGSSGATTGPPGGTSATGTGGSGGTSSGLDATAADAPRADASIHGEAGALPSGISLLYKCTDTNPSDSQLAPSYTVSNTGTSTFVLGDFRIRYYLTNEAKIMLLSDYLYAEVNGGAGYRDIRADASVVIAPLAPPEAGADTYVDLVFNMAAGTLAPGQTSRIDFTVHTPGFAANLNESDDYSHDLTKTDYGPNDKVTLYYQDQLVAGVEP